MSGVSNSNASLIPPRVQLGYSLPDVNRDILEPNEVYPLARSECVLLCDSSDRLSSLQSPFNFTVNCKTQIQNPRRIGCAGMIITPIPQINKKNSSMIMEINGNTLVRSFKEGFYDYASFQTQLLFELQQLDANFTVSADPITNTYTILNGTYNFRFLSCDFIKYGVNVHGFKTTSVAASSLQSANVNMIYTNYIVLRSFNLTKWTSKPNLVSNSKTNILAMFPYLVGDNLEKSSVVLNANPNYISSISHLDINDMDFAVEDEFGNNLDGVMPNYITNSKCVIMVRVQL